MKHSRNIVITALKAALGHHEDANYMFYYYLNNPKAAKHILKMCGRPQHFHKQNCEKQTIKLHKIL